MSTADYLAWARQMDIWLHGHPDCDNLFSSAVYEPADMLLDDLRSAYPDNIMERLADPAAWGHPRLREAIARAYGIEDQGRLLLTSGATMAFFLVCQALLRAGDHAIVESPSYQPFVKVLAALGVEISLVRREGDAYHLSLGALKAQIRPQTRLIVLTNPHNPSGMLLEDDLLQEVGDLAAQHNGHVVVDEVYGDLVPGRRLPAALLHSAILTVNSLSKSYGLGALRCGWIVAVPEAMDRIRPLHIIFDNSSSRITQVIASVVLDNLPRYRQWAMQVVAANRPLVEAFAQALRAQGAICGDVPPHGCIYFPRVNGVEDIGSLVTEMAEQRGVLVVPGHFFGAADHIRIGFGGRPEAVQRGLRRLADALARL